MLTSAKLIENMNKTYIRIDKKWTRFVIIASSNRISRTILSLWCFSLDYSTTAIQLQRLINSGSLRASVRDPPLLLSWRINSIALVLFSGISSTNKIELFRGCVVDCVVSFQVNLSVCRIVYTVFITVNSAIRHAWLIIDHRSSGYLTPFIVSLLKSRTITVRIIKSRLLYPYSLYEFPSRSLPFWIII